MNATLSALHALYDDVVVEIVWSQGENDAKRIADGATSAQTYKNATLAVFDYVRDHVDPNIPIFIDEIGSSNFVGTDARFNAGHPVVRAMQQEIAAEHQDIHIGAITEDLPLKDVVHLSDDSYEVVGVRLANYIGYVAGLTDVVTGPRPTPDPDQVIDPANTAPSVTAEIFALKVGVGPQSKGGNILANDLDPDGDPLVTIQVVGSTGAAALTQTQTNISGSYGHLLINASGTFTYAIDQNASTRAISAEQSATETFTYTVSDGRGGKSATTLKFTITGQNDAPVAKDDIVTAASTNVNPVTGNVIRDPVGGDFDYDSSDTLSVTSLSYGSNTRTVGLTDGTLAGAFGLLTLNTNGGYSYLVDRANSAVSGLVAGASLTDVFQYAIADGHGGTSVASLTVMIQTHLPNTTTYGLPTVSGTTGADVLRGTTGDDIIAGFEGNDSLKGYAGNDIIVGGDGVDVIEGNEGNDIIVGGLGFDSLKGGDGNDRFVLNSLLESGDTIQDFRPGDSFDVSAILQLSGYTASQAFQAGYLRLTQVGANVRVDLDIDGSVGNTAPVSIATLASATANTVQQTQFVVTSPGSPSPAPPSNTVLSNVDTVEDAAPLSVNLLSGALGTSVANVSALPLGFTLSGSILSINPAHASFQSLTLNEKKVIPLTFDVLDNAGTVVHHALTINVTGRNDVPVAGAPLTVTRSEDSAKFTLDLLLGATDIDAGSILSVANVTGLSAGLTLQGAILSIDPSDAAFQSLASGAQKILTVGYDIVDRAGGSTHQTANIVISGVDETPPVVPPPTSSIIVGTPNSDTLQGFDGSNDIVIGFSGNDKLKGLGGNDQLFGGIGIDDLEGGNGDDLMVGGLGADIIRTGSGNDTVEYASLTESGDTITDFSSTDKIDLSGLLHLPASMNGADAISEGYIRFTQVGSGVVVNVDLDGKLGPEGFASLLTLQNKTVSGLDANQLLVTGDKINHAPFAVNDIATISLPIAQSISGNVLTGDGADFDMENNTLKVSSVGIADIAVGAGAVSLVGVYGTLQIEQDGAYTYAVSQSFLDAAHPQGSIFVERFDYVVTDPAGEHDRGTLSLSIMPSVYESRKEGGNGNDSLLGTDKGDFLIGGSGNDKLTGYLGNDLLLGGDGDDTLIGSDGDDILAGGAGNDSLKGSLGADTIVFSAGHGFDIVQELRAGDTLVFSPNLFTSAQQVMAAVQVISSSRLLLSTPDGGSIQFEGSSLADLQHVVIAVQDLTFG